MSFMEMYRSAVSSGGNSAKGTQSGMVAGYAVAFLVNWKEEFASVTPWLALSASDGEVSANYSLWHVASNPAEDEVLLAVGPSGHGTVFPCQMIFRGWAREQPKAMSVRHII